MPAAKEKWEIQFEEYRDTLISLGAVIKNEKALKTAYKIYREKIPERIYKTCVDEIGAQKAQPETAPGTTTASRPETKKEATTRQNQAENNSGPKETSSDTAAQGASGHSDIAPNARQNNSRPEHSSTPKKENRDGKPRLTQKERFENYKSKLVAKGITVTDEAGLWELFRSIRGRLDYSQIGEFVTFPERKRRDNNRENDNRDRNQRRPEDNNNRDRRNQNKDGSQNTGKDKPAPDKTRFEEYCESLMAQGFEIVDKNQFARLYNKQKGFINQEQLKDLVRKVPENKSVITNASVSNANLPVSADTKLPVIIEGTFADKWVKPLQKWVDTDRDNDGKPKRALTAVKADNNSVVIDIVPTGKYAEENADDAGARYSFAKKNQRGDIESTLGSKDGSPLDYEYFRRLMVTYRKNGIGAIAFKDISTDEFRDKLLAAALEFDMKMIGAPEKIDFNADHLKKLPAAVKIKLGIYNGDLSTSGKPMGEVKKDILKRKEEQRSAPKASAVDKKEKPAAAPLSLPPSFASREME